MRAWGYNASGELGNGTTTNSASPVLVSGLTGVVAAAAGTYHSLALKNDGTVWTWGYNAYGQLGDGTTTDHSSPTEISSLSGIVAIAAGTGQSLALKNDGTVWTWGDNAYGELGDGTTNSRSSPAQIGGLSGIVAIAAGYRHSLALKSDGTVWAWGYGADGQLGNASFANQNSPVQVAIGAVTVIAIAAGNYHSVAVVNDGTVRAWGYNGSGQLADGTTSNRWAPVYMTGTSSAVAASAGSLHTAVLNRDGSIWVSGDNSHGQIGDGTTMNRLTAVAVDDLFPGNGVMPTGWTAPSGSWADWTVVSDAAFAGLWSLKSGTVGDLQTSATQVSGNFRDGFVRFRDKVSSEPASDFLRLYVDGVKKGEWSGTLDWNQAGTFITAGSHTIAWKYEKNNSGSAGSDAAWIDSVELPTTFNDISSTSTFFDYINALKDAGITSGCGSGNYCPSQTVTRDQMAAFIVRAKEGEPSASCNTAPFSDVPTANSFCKYISRMSALGITTGCGSGNYCPSQTVTRDQMAAFIIRAVKGNPPAGYCGTTPPFNDVPVSSTFCGHIMRMAERGITTGCGSDNYCPSQSVTRDQMAAFLGRAFLGM